MSAPVLRALLLWGIAMLAGLAIAWQSRFTADMSFVLPLHPSPTQEVMIRQIKEGVVTRLLMVGIQGGDAEQRAAFGLVEPRDGFLHGVLRRRNGRRNQSVQMPVQMRLCIRLRRRLSRNGWKCETPPSSRER